MIKPEISSYRIILNIVLSVMSYIVPKEKNSVLFGAGRGELFKGNPKYFYLYLIDNKKNVSSWWITENISVYNYLKSINKPVVYKYSVKGFFKILRCRVIIIDFSMKDFSYMGTLLGKFNIVQTWHGIALKYIGLKEFEFFDRSQQLSKATKILSLLKRALQKKEYKSYRFILSGSPTETENLKVSFGIDKIKMLGFPRNDILLNSHIPLADLREIIPLRDYKAVILYAPTFRDVAGLCRPFFENFLDFMNEELSRRDYLMLVKKHPHDIELSIPDNLSNIVDISSTVDDIQELLIYSDLLITDYSSVFFDFILTGRPVIYYIYDIDSYLANSRGMYFDYFSEIPGPFARTEDKLLQLIMTFNEWSHELEYKLRYDKFVNKFHYYRDSNSCERLFESIKSLL